MLTVDCQADFSHNLRPIKESFVEDFGSRFLEVLKESTVAFQTFKRQSKATKSDQNKYLFCKVISFALFLFAIIFFVFLLVFLIGIGIVRSFFSSGRYPARRKYCGATARMLGCGIKTGGYEPHKIKMFFCLCYFIFVSFIFCCVLIFCR